MEIPYDVFLKPLKIPLSSFLIDPPHVYEVTIYIYIYMFTLHIHRYTYIKVSSLLHMPLVFLTK